MGDSKLKKHFNNIISTMLVVLIGLYLMYEKGYIMVDFERLSVIEAYELIKKDSNVTVLDVRTQREYLNDGKIKGAMLMPLGTLQEEISKLRFHKTKKILVYCRSGRRSISASRTLVKFGFKAYNVNGGLDEWKAKGLPIQIK